MKALGLAALLLVTFTSYAQNQPPASTRTGAESVHFGLKAGINIAELEDNRTTYKTDARAGYYAGVLAHIVLTPNWALQPEILFSAQGAKYSSLGTEQLNFINIPVLAQYLFTSGLRLETGPQLGILTSAKLDNGATENDIKNQFKDIDYSWSFGAGYITPAGLGIDVRYNLGINNIVTAAGHNVKNRVWQLGVFYQFSR